MTGFTTFTELSLKSELEDSDIFGIDPSGGSDSKKVTGSIIKTYVEDNILISQSQVVDLTTDLSSKINLSGGTMTGPLSLSGDPSTDLEATTKQYVDSKIFSSSDQGICRLATTSALNSIYDNGAAGVGATLTNAGAQVLLSIDGVVTEVGMIVLIKDQSNSFENGIYTITNPGSGVSSWSMERVAYFNDTSEIVAGYNISISFGTYNAKTQWLLVTDVASIGVDSIDFESNIVSGTGILKVNNAISLSDSVATSYVSSAGTAVPLFSLLNVVGGSSLSTSAAGDTLTISSPQEIYTHSNVQFGALSLGLSDTSRILYSYNDSSDSFSPLFERAALINDEKNTVINLLATKSSDMGAQFGAAISFNIQDISYVINEIGKLSVSRRSADNIGEYVFEADGGSGLEELLTLNADNAIFTSPVITSGSYFNLSSSGDYRISGNSVLSSTTLGSSVVNSSLTSVGTLTSINIDNINVDGNTISSTNSNGNINIVPNGTGQVDVFSPPASESAGIDVNGTIYNSALRVNDIGGSVPAQFIVHKHSTTLSPVILGARSNSNTDSHGVVSLGQKFLSMTGAGWTGSHYDIFGRIDIGASSSGTISSTSSPGAMYFSVSSNGSNLPSIALTIESDKSASFTGNINTSGLYKIGGIDVLSSTGLGSGVVNSSLTSVGTLTSLQVDNININGNTVSTTNTNGDLTFSTNGVGAAYFDCSVGIGTDGPKEAIDLRGGRFVINPNSAVNIGAATTTKGANLTVYSGDAEPLNQPALINIINGNLHPATNFGKIEFAGSLSSIAQLSAGTYTAVTSGRVMGDISFLGDDGTDLRTIGSYIRSVVNTSNEPVSSNVVPLDIIIQTVFESDIKFYTDNTHAMTIAHDQKVGIDETSPVNRLDVSGAIGVGSSVSGIVTAPANGMAIQGNIEFYGTGVHAVKFNDYATGSLYTGGISIESDNKFNIFGIFGAIVNTGMSDLTFQGNSGSSVINIAKFYGGGGDIITATPTGAAPNVSFISNNSGSAVYGSVSMYLDEAGNNLKFKVVYSNGTTFKTGTVALT